MRHTLGPYSTEYVTGGGAGPRAQSQIIGCIADDDHAELAPNCAAAAAPWPLLAIGAGMMSGCRHALATNWSSKIFVLTRGWCLMRQRLVFQRLYFQGPVVPDSHVDTCQHTSRHANADMV